jgi:hypothetical protein
MNRYDELTPPEQAEADAIINAMASGASFQRVPIRPVPALLQINLTHSSDDWDEFPVAGDHPVALLFRDAQTSEVAVIDRHGDVRRFRRGFDL